MAYPEHAALTAADFWAVHGCNAILVAHADDSAAAAATREIIEERTVRRIVNGGEIGIANVLVQLQRAKAIWRDEGAVPVKVVTSPVAASSKV